MKKLNILVALLSVLLFSTSASAGEVTVTGSVKASIATSGSDSTAGTATTGQGKSVAVSNDINFGATGELDNGYTWNWQTQLDAGAIDDTRLEITVPGMLTFGLYGTEGGLNFKHGGSQMALGYGSQVGSSGGLVDPADIADFNNIQLHTPAGLLPLDMVIKAGVSASGSATSEAGDAPVGTASSFKDGVTYSIDMAPVDGAKFGATYFTNDAENIAVDDGQVNENGAVYASYKMGAWGVGVSKAVSTPAFSKSVPDATDLANYYETDSLSVGFVVNDTLSLSAGIEKSARNLLIDANVQSDLEITVVQAAYNMGGMTLTAGLKEIENSGYVANADVNEAHLVISMDF